MIYILIVKLNVISLQCLVGAKPLHMKSEYETTANKKKCSLYICVLFSEANLILDSLERVLSWEGLELICNWRKEKESIVLPTLFGSVTQKKVNNVSVEKSETHTCRKVLTDKIKILVVKHCYLSWGNTICSLLGLSIQMTMFKPPLQFSSYLSAEYLKKTPKTMQICKYANMLKEKKM